MGICCPQAKICFVLFFGYSSSGEMTFFYFCDTIVSGFDFRVSKKKKKEREKKETEIITKIILWHSSTKRLSDSSRRDGGL